MSHVDIESNCSNRYKEESLKYFHSYIIENLTNFPPITSPILFKFLYYYFIVNIFFYRLKKCLRIIYILRYIFIFNIYIEIDNP